MKIDKQALVRAAQSIKGNFGDLSDLPDELVNSLANIYFNFHSMRGATMPKSPEEYARFMDNAAHVTSAVEFLPEMVKALRSVRADQTAEPQIHEFMVQHLLDIVKYRMDPGFASNASELERRQRRDPSKVKEIPDLAVKMGLLQQRAKSTTDQTSAGVKASFQFLPTVPDFTKRKPTRAFMADAFTMFLLKDVPSLAGGMTYPLVMAAIDTSVQKPVYFVTLERSSHGEFICGFEDTGGHVNFGEFPNTSEREFISRALEILKNVLRVSNIVEMQERASGKEHPATAETDPVAKVAPERPIEPPPVDRRDKRIWTFLILAACFWAVMFILDRLQGSENYNDCILKNMKGVTSDRAALFVRRACREKFPDASNSVARGSSFSPNDPTHESSSTP